MEIKITWGIGEGKTKIAAFDKALWDAGIANYNIIRLSSVIPENARINVKKVDLNPDEHGYRLYVVISDSYQERPGKSAVAGLGWAVSRQANGKGVFVEHSGDNVANVTKYIEETVKSMVSYRPERFGEASIKTVEKQCRTKGNVVCALVAAVYRSEGW